MADRSITRGDTRVYDLAFKDAAGAALNITDASIWFTAKRSRSDADADAVFQLTIGAGITVTNAVGGLATAEVTPGHTDDITIWTLLYYDIQIKDSTGKTYTVEEGTIAVIPDTTQAT